MQLIDQAHFQFSPKIGLAVAIMVGFLVFAVALDLTWEQFRSVLRKPKAPAIGLVAQYIILPAVAFGVGMSIASTPSVALGVLLVTCCPAGALSNYLTGVARGNVATSVSMTAISTLFSIVVTPILFAFWASMNPDTRAILQQIAIDPKRVVMVLLIMLVIPIAIGMFIRARHADTAERIRVWARRIAGGVFAVVVAVLLLGNIDVLRHFTEVALPPVLLTFVIAAALGWGLARVTGLAAADRRAVTLEVAFQNVALAIGMAVAFFPALAGVAITSILWGVTHLTLGFALAAVWKRIPLGGTLRRSRATESERRAVVIGGSFTGLLTARVLSKHFSQVILLERDPIEDVPKSRKGQPQTRHPHVLLPHGLDQMERYFPGLADQLRAGGATLADFGTAVRWYASGGYRVPFESRRLLAMMSRPFFEWKVRQRVLALPNVTLRPECAVSELRADDTGRVTGVDLLDRARGGEPEFLSADLVVDTTGRGTRSPQWLSALGFPSPEKEAVEIGLCYTSRIYRRSADAPARVTLITPDPPRTKRLGVVVPIEGERWLVMLAGYGGDQAPTDPDGFLQFARSLDAPDVFQQISTLEPLGDPYVYRFPSNLRRHFEQLRTFPERYLVLGDAVSSFNPVYAQGMTSALLQAAELDALLEERSSLDGLWRPYFRRVARIVDTAWQLAVGADFLFPGTVGPKPAGTDLINRYVGRVQRATHSDEVVYNAFLEVMNLNAPPPTLFKPGILFRVFRATRSDPGKEETDLRQSVL